MGGDLSLAWDALQPLLMLGFTFGVVFAIVAAAFKLGIRFAPYIFFGALLIWFFSG